MSRTTTLVLPALPRELYDPTRGTTFSNVTSQKEENVTSLSLSPRSDLKSLIEGKVKCTNPCPPSTEKTRKEAFSRYMKIIYRVPYNIKVEFEEDSDEITFEPEYYFNTPHTFTAVDDKPAPKIFTPIIKVKEKKKKRKKKKKAALTEEAVSESEEEPEPVVETPKPEKEKKEKKTTVKEATTEEPVRPPKTPDLPPAPVLRPVPAPKPKTPPSQEPSPEPPQFTKEFSKKPWFEQICPDKKSIPSDPSPDSFTLLLVDFLCSCDSHLKPEIISVLESLHRRKLLQNIDLLYQKLINALPKLATPNMSPNDQAILVQMLNLLMSLKSVNDELVKTLLVLYAYKDLGLRKRILQIVVSLGVGEAEQWLGSEIETWESELLSKSNIWNGLSIFADCWLNLWTAKYKDHSRDMFLRSTEKWKPVSFTAVDVLNFFCSDQKQEFLKSQQAQPRTDNVVILPLKCDCRVIHRLGETYTMSRVRTPPNFILPPLRDRPKLLDIPPFLSLGLPRVKLSPFHNNEAEYGLEFLHRRYYITEKSQTEYYR